MRVAVIYAPARLESRIVRTRNSGIAVASGFALVARTEPPTAITAVTTPFGWPEPPPKVWQVIRAGRAAHPRRHHCWMNEGIESSNNGLWGVGEFSAVWR
jgi:hypothetical protein